MLLRDEFIVKNRGTIIHFPINRVLNKFQIEIRNEVRKVSE